MKKMFFLLLIILSCTLNAQDGSIDNTFNTSDVGFNSGFGVTGFASTTAIQADGKILIGGSFNGYNNVGKKDLARLNSDGTLDAAFPMGSGLGNIAGSAERLTAIMVQPNGKIIIVGFFKFYNGIARNNVARLNSDGSLDTSFNPGLGTDNTIYSIVLQQDGKIILAGEFTTYNGSVRNSIVRIDSSGNLDSTFNPGLGANSSISEIKIQSDGKIIISGGFSLFNEINRNRIARLNSDGSLDNTFNPGTGANNSIRCLTIQSDGSIIIGGNFSSYNGVIRNYIARLDINGTLDLSFNIDPNLFNNQFNSTISSINMQQNGAVVITGIFNTTDGISGKGIVRLNLDGSSDTTFSSGTGTDRIVSNAAVQSDGKIIMVGGFSTYNSDNKFGINRLEINGVSDSSFNSGGLGANRSINKILVQSDGKILIGGSFRLYNGVAKNGFASLNSDGSLDSSFNTGIGGFAPSVEFINKQTDGKFIIGGNFSSYNGIAISKVARLNPDGTLDTTFNYGTDTNFQIFSIAIQNDGKILLGRSFFINNISSRKIVRLNIDGSLDNSFIFELLPSTAFPGIRIQPDGKIIVVGTFTSINGIATNQIARLNINNTVDSTFNIGTGFNNSSSSDTLVFYDVFIQSNGKIIVTGNFNNFNGIIRNNIARLNTDGSLDNSFNSGIGPTYPGITINIQNIATQTDGKIIINGDFTGFDGIPIKNLARLNANGTLDSTFNPGTSTNGIISLAFQPDNKIIICGSFSSFNGTGRNRIARINSGVLSTNNFDFEKQVNLWPNPTKDLINFSINEQLIVEEVKLFDFTGKIILKQNNTNTISLSAFAKGIYFVEIFSERGKIIKKVIKE